MTSRAIRTSEGIYRDRRQGIRRLGVSSVTRHRTGGKLRGIAEYSRRGTADYRAAQLAREYLHDALDHAVTLDELAAATSRDRWSLSRDFRAFFGMSPHRYLTMRRLDRVRQLIVQGWPLADAAAAAGFADQSHMTRHFVKTYGLPPSRWLKTLAAQQQVR